MDQLGNSAWMRVVGQMQQAERSLDRDDIWAVAATHQLADMIVELEPQLARHQREALIGLGALFARQAQRETMAAIEADLALRRVALG